MCVIENTGLRSLRCLAWAGPCMRSNNRMGARVCETYRLMTASPAQIACVPLCEVTSGE